MLNSELTCENFNSAWLLQWRCQKFSKISSTVILHSDLSGTLTFEGFSKCLAAAVAQSKILKSWICSDSCSKSSSALTFENFQNSWLLRKHCQLHSD